jgi:hypothetical protein
LIGVWVRARFFLLVLVMAGCAAPAQSPGYRLITDRAESAQPAAIEILRHLAAGELEQAAALSNAPQRRLEVLRDFRDAVGEQRFRELYGRFFAPENRVVLEAAIGPRRLLVWDLGEAGKRLAGQYFVAVDGRFLLDDVPNDQRSQLQRVLQKLRP